MKFEHALTLIDEYLCRLDNAYGRPVFDEWAVVTEDGRGVWHYCGQRESHFGLTLSDDLVKLRAVLAADRVETYTGGEFGFARDGDGLAFDAYICLGEGLFLVCNHTSKSMAAITADPNWKRAQGVFFDLSQRFAGRPVAVASALR